MVSSARIEPVFACPCCGYLTLPTRGDWEICPVCFWEDDPGTDADGWSGANSISLFQAQENFLAFGACTERDIANVRPPTHEEIPR